MSIEQKANTVIAYSKTVTEATQKDPVDLGEVERACTQLAAACEELAVEVE